MNTAGYELLYYLDLRFRYVGSDVKAIYQKYRVDLTDVLMGKSLKYATFSDWIFAVIDGFIIALNNNEISQTWMVPEDELKRLITKPPRLNWGPVIHAIENRSELLEELKEVCPNLLSEIDFTSQRLEQWKCGDILTSIEATNFARCCLKYGKDQIFGLWRKKGKEEQLRKLIPSEIFKMGKFEPFIAGGPAVAPFAPRATRRRVYCNRGNFSLLCGIF